MSNHVGLKIKSFTFSRVLGEGAWAKVYQCYDEKTMSSVACKVIPKRLMDQTPKLKELVQTQITVLQRCKNQNVIKFIDSVTTEKEVFIFTEFCNGGDMEQYLNKKKTLKQDEAVEFLKQILNGFRGLHEVNAMHRDFKAANILLHNGVAKIADLGFAKIVKQQQLTTTILGTSVTMAPQLLENKTYGNQCDIWSVGVVYYQLLIGDYPYNAFNDHEILKKIKKQRPKFPQNIQISQDSKDFINRCLIINPKERITWKEIYQHPLLVEKKNNYRNTYLGSLVSKISMNGNRNFYEQNNNLPEKNPLYPKIDPFQFQKVEIEQTQNFEKIQLQMKQKKEIQKAIIGISQLYLSRRNYIMLPFKYGIMPIFNDLVQIPFNQNVYAFLMAKKAYFEMKEYRKTVAEKMNCFSIKIYWNQFLKSRQYQNLLQKLNNDYETIQLYAQSFLMQINTNQYNFKSQLNLNGIGPKFTNVFKEELTSYAFQLYDQKDNKRFKIITILRLITFCMDLATGIPVKSQQYDAKIEKLSKADMEAAFQIKMNEVFS